MAEETMYAWTPIYAGGEAKEVKGPGGVVRNIIQSRNVIAVGERVDKEELTEGSPDPDADWEAFIESGAIRPYKFPEDLDPASTESPLEFLRRRLREAAEVQLNEEEQLLLATGQGAVVSDEELASMQPSDAKGVKEASGQAEPAAPKGQK